MSTQVTYGNKVGVVPKEVHINQVWDDDMNEIKTAINNNAAILDTVEAETDVNTLDIIDLQDTKALKNNVTQKTADYSATIGDYVLAVTGAPSSITITLPLSTSLNKGGEISVIKQVDDAFTVTIDTTSSQLINGNLTQTISEQFVSLTFVSIGTGWYIKSDSQQAIISYLNEEKGWAHYVDDISANQTISSTPSKLTINSLGVTNNNDYLPKEIRGISDLWDSTTNKIIPIGLGDSYDLRIDLSIVSKLATPTELTFTLDIGGGATITQSVLTRFISLSKTPPYTVSVGFPIFCLATFITNGGQIFLNTDTGSIDIGLRNILIKRDYKG